MKLSTVSCLILLWFMIGCTVTKQRYSTGYHVEWKKHLDRPLSTSNSGESGEPEDSSIEDISNEINYIETDKEVAVENIGEETLTKMDLIDKRNKQTKSIQRRNSLNCETATSSINKSNITSSHSSLLIKKRNPPIGRLHMRPSEEYLKGALGALLGGIFFVGLFVLSVLVFEFAELSIGALIFTLFGVIGACMLLTIPILLVLALISFLVYG